MSDNNFSDKVSSWYCGKKVAYDFCKDGPDEDCDKKIGDRGAGNIRSALKEKGQRFTSVYLSEYDPMEEPAAILFDKVDCNGRFGRFFAPTKFGISNDYHETAFGRGKEMRRLASNTRLESAKWNIESDSMKSLMVPHGVTIQLYESNEFIEDSLIIVGESFINENQEMKCINIDDIDERFENTVSSIKVYKTGDEISKGIWRQIAATNSLEIDLEVGF